MASDVFQLERRNPLPLGYYWQDIPRKDAPAFNAWLKDQDGAVTVERVAPGNPAFVLFHVTAPDVIWKGPDVPRVGRAGLEKTDVHHSSRIRASSSKSGGGKMGALIAALLGGAVGYLLGRSRPPQLIVVTPDDPTPATSPTSAPETPKAPGGVS